MAIHKNLMGDEAVHQADYYQSSDPGAVGDDKNWWDTTTTPPTLKRRGTSNSAWTVLGQFLNLLTTRTANTVLAGPTSGSAAAPTFRALVRDDIPGPTVTTESGTSRTLALTDANDYIRCTSASATAITFPPNSSVAFPVGTTVTLEQGAAGAVTITPDSGVTINVHADFTLVTDGQYAVASVTKVGTDTWTAYGKLVPA